jgi:hypothetical protein
VLASSIHRRHHVTSKAVHEPRKQRTEAGYVCNKSLHCRVQDVPVRTIPACLKRREWDEE